ncbi:uncharacterized protein [Dermacentor albipictus]|uniref:uncharacterized protein isoform X1 n=1 Tax=Dermacentor albipictus TaxID=60249 RepID=UPI0038FCBEF2
MDPEESHDADAKPASCEAARTDHADGAHRSGASGHGGQRLSTPGDGDEEAPRCTVFSSPEKVRAEFGESDNLDGELCFLSKLAALEVSEDKGQPDWGVTRVLFPRTTTEHPVGGDTCHFADQAQEQFISSGDTLSGGRDVDATGAMESGSVVEPRRREHPSPEAARAETSEDAKPASCEAASTDHADGAHRSGASGHGGQRLSTPGDGDEEAPRCTVLSSPEKVRAEFGESDNLDGELCFLSKLAALEVSEDKGQPDWCVTRVLFARTTAEHPVGGDTCHFADQVEEQFRSSGDTLSGGSDIDATGAKESSCVDEPRRREHPSLEAARAETTEGAKPAACEAACTDHADGTHRSGASGHGGQRLSTPGDGDDEATSALELSFVNELRCLEFTSSEKVRAEFAIRDVLDSEISFLNKLAALKVSEDKGRPDWEAKPASCEAACRDHSNASGHGGQRLSTPGDGDGKVTGAAESSFVNEPRCPEFTSSEKVRAEFDIRDVLNSELSLLNKLAALEVSDEKGRPDWEAKPASCEAACTDHSDASGQGGQCLSTPGDGDGKVTGAAESGFVNEPRCTQFTSSEKVRADSAERDDLRSELSFLNKLSALDLCEKEGRPDWDMSMADHNAFLDESSYLALPDSYPAAAAFSRFREKLRLESRRAVAVSPHVADVPPVPPRPRPLTGAPCAGSLSLARGRKTQPPSQRGPLTSTPIAGSGSLARGRKKRWLPRPAPLTSTPIAGSWSLARGKNKRSLPRPAPLTSTPIAGSWSLARGKNKRSLPRPAPLTSTPIAGSWSLARGKKKRSLPRPAPLTSTPIAGSWSLARGRKKRPLPRPAPLTSTPAAYPRPRPRSPCP